MASLFGGGNDTQTTTKTTAYPDWVDASQQQQQDWASSLLGPFLSQVGQSGVAGVNPDQQMGWGLGRDFARSAFNSSSGYQPFGPTQNASFVEGRGAAQIDPNAYKGFMNPYTSSVVDATRRVADQDFMRKDAMLAGKYGMANAYGGSGEALARGQNAADSSNNLDQLVAQLYSQGFDKSQALAGQNAGYQQQANMQGQSIANAMSGHNVDENNRYGYQNTVNNNAATQQAIQMLLSGGATQRDVQNQAIQWPFQALQMLAGITPKQLNSTETKVEPDNSPDPFMQLLGLGLSAAKLSDFRFKKNISLARVDAATGLPIYDWHYVWQSDDEPRQRGPMAQDVQKIAPQHVVEVGGVLFLTRA